MAPVPIVDALISRHEADVSSPTFSLIQAHDLAKRTADIFKRGAGSQNFAAGQGAKPPAEFNNQLFLALFATIGGLMVLASLWFFFWAKNGGFKYQEGDWDDYKSTVLRRKGPDGKTLSNATKSTKLGGSTIAGTQHYKWAKHAAKSVVSYDEKGRKGVMGKRGWAKTHSVLYSDDFTSSYGTQTVSDMTEIREEPEVRDHHSKRYRDRDIKEYKKERPARVGGINRVGDGYTTEGSHVSSAASETPILREDNRNQEKERAERNARVEAAKMERRWKKEAEEAAAALARENARSIPQPKKSVSPSKPSPAKQRQSSGPAPRSTSRSASPKKRDFSYQSGPPSEILSTAYTGASSNRSASYYNAYRPRADSNPPGPAPPPHGNHSRQSSPKKKPQAGRSGGYRRGADSDFD